MYSKPRLTYDSDENCLDEYDRMCAQQFLAPFFKPEPKKRRFPQVSPPQDNDEPPWDDSEFSKTA